VHLIRNTFRLTSRRDWDAVKRDVKPIYTAVNAEAARAALDELARKWGSRYGAVIRLWEIKCLYLVTRSLDPTGTGRTRPERLRRPLPVRRNVLTKTTGNTFGGEIDPQGTTSGVNVAGYCLAKPAMSSFLTAVHS